MFQNMLASRIKCIFKHACFYFFFSKKEEVWLTCASKNIFEHGREQEMWELRQASFGQAQSAGKSWLNKQVFSDNVNLFTLSSSQDFNKNTQQNVYVQHNSHVIRPPCL